MTGAARLTMGPVLFNWPAEQWRDFYFRIADEAPVEVVTVGEVVCAKRWPFFEPYLAEVTQRLENAGKEVVHSTLALVLSEGEMDAVRATVARPGVLVEANDISTVALLSGRRYVVGPFVNVYNEGTLGHLARRGAIRVVPPGELSAGALAVLARSGVEIEVQAFGRLPLAISARCYHARANDLRRDNCRFVCAGDPDGMALETLDGDGFLAVNGPHTLSYAYCNLVGELDALAGMGIGCFRLWPHSCDMVAVAQAFRDVLDGRADTGEAVARIAGLVGDAPFSNGFIHGGEGARFVSQGPLAAG